MLDEGEVNNRSDLAKRVELTRARITQVLNLLKLPARILNEVATIHEPAQIAFYMERRLRPIINIESNREQIRAFQHLKTECVSFAKTAP